MQTHTQPLFQCKASGDLHSQGYMDGATTLLWMPKRKRRRRTKQLRAKTGWYSRDCMNVTCSNTSQIPCDILKWNMGNGLWLHNLVSARCLSAPFRSLVCLTLSLDLAEHFLIIMTIIINDFGPLSTENKYMYDVLRAWDPLNELYTQGRNSWDRSWVFKGITYLMLLNFNNLHESACNESHVMNQPETSEREPPPSPAPFFFFWDWMQIYTTWFDNNYMHRYCYNN